MKTEKHDCSVYFHLPGLFEFYELYRVFLPLFREHREYFYDWCEIGSIYGAPADCIWGGGRVGFGDQDPREVLALMQEYGISARLTFSNSLLRKEHLSDRKCNRLCRLFGEAEGVQNGVIVYSDLLLDYLKKSGGWLKNARKNLIFAPWTFYPPGGLQMAVCLWYNRAILEKRGVPYAYG